MKKQKIDIGMLPRAIPIYSDCHFSWCEQGYAKFVRVKAKKQYFLKKENRRWHLFKQGLVIYEDQ
jgi:hypothetical protein